MRRIGVTQAVNAAHLVNASAVLGTRERALNGARRQCVCTLGAAEQKLIGTVQPPVTAQLVHQRAWQRHQTVLRALALFDAQQLPLAVDVIDTQRHQFAHAQTTAVTQLQHQPILGVTARIDNRAHIATREQIGNALGNPRCGDVNVNREPGQ